MTYKIILHDDTLGVTKPALKALRDELARRFQHKIAVIVVPAGGDENECYGVFIVDQTTLEVAVIGDGFRGDGGGEGGTGHRAAQALLRIFGIRPIEALPEDAIHFSDDPSLYRDSVDSMVRLAEEVGFVCPAMREPERIEWLFRQRS